MKTGQYQIRYYDKHGTELKQYKEVEEGLTVANELAEWRVADKGIHSFTIDRRIFDSLDKEF